MAILIEISEFWTKTVKTLIVIEKSKTQSLNFVPKMQNISINVETPWFLSPFSACSGSFQPSLVWSRLVQTNLVYSSQIQTNLVKSSQILSNLEKSFLGYFWQHITHVVDLYSLVQSRLDQRRSIQSTLVKAI